MTEEARFLVSETSTAPTLSTVNAAGVFRPTSLAVPRSVKTFATPTTEGREAASFGPDARVTNRDIACVGESAFCRRRRARTSVRTRATRTKTQTATGSTILTDPGVLRTAWLQCTPQRTKLVVGLNRGDTTASARVDSSDGNRNLRLRLLRHFLPPLPLHLRVRHPHRRTHHLLRVHPLRFLRRPLRRLRPAHLLTCHPLGADALFLRTSRTVAHTTASRLPTEANLASCSLTRSSLFTRPTPLG